MKAYVGTFRVRTGSGLQTVSGIVDKDGVAFTPEYIFFVNGSSILETLYSNPTSLTNCVTACSNMVRVSDKAAGYNAAGDIPQFGTKISSGAGGTGPSAVLCSLEPNAAFGGWNYRYAALVSGSSGAFELNITTDPPAFTTDVMFLALAATSGDLIIGPEVNMSATYTITDAKGLINPKVSGIAVGGGIATGAGGGGGWGWGWDSPNGGPMAGHVVIPSQNDDMRYQRTNAFWNSIGISTPFTAVDGAAVSQWNPTNVVVTGGNASGYLISGSGIRTTSGTFNQRVGIGNQIVDLNINARCFFLMSVGSPASSVLQTDWAEACVAFCDGIRKASYWFGENANTMPLNGAAFISAQTLLRFAVAGPLGASTVFTSIANFVSLQNDGRLTIDWTVNDDVPRQIMWFAIGSAPIPPDYSGIYYTNPNKLARHDTYIGVEKKIPDPTIKTALLGD